MPYVSQCNNAYCEEGEEGRHERGVISKSAISLSISCTIFTCGYASRYSNCEFLLILFFSSNVNQ